MLFQLRFLRRHTLADSLVRVVGLPVTNVGVCLIGCGLCRVNFGFQGKGGKGSSGKQGTDAAIRCDSEITIQPVPGNLWSRSGCHGFGDINSCPVGSTIFHIQRVRCLKNRLVHLVVCDVPYLFHVCRDSVATAVQSSVTVCPCVFFLLNFLRNGRIRENVVPVGCIAFKVGQPVRMLCDFCSIVRNVFRVGADIGVLNDLFGLDGVDIGRVGGDTVTQRGIGVSACLCFGCICRLIGRVKVRNSLLAVGGLLRNGSGVGLLCGLCAVDFSVQTGCQVGNVGFNSIQTLAPCCHILFPLNNLLVPTVDKFGEPFVVFLELLNQSGQVGDGFLEVCELIVIIGRLDPILGLSFRIRGQLCAFRHIALRGVAVAVMDDDS